MNDVTALHILKYFITDASKQKFGLAYAFYNSEVGKIIINFLIQCQEPCPQEESRRSLFQVCCG